MHVDLLRKVLLFEGLSEQELSALDEVTVLKRFRKDNMLILAEEEGDTLFVINRGRVKVTILSEDGREIILSMLGPGEFFGELSLLDGKPRSANVVTTEETELLMLRRSEFIQLIHKIPPIAAKLLAELAGRLRKTDRKIEGLALLDVTSRISETLLQLADEQGIPVRKGVLIRHRPTHQELANMSGTTRETVSRVLKRLEREQYIASEGRNLTILKAPAEWDTRSS